MDGWGRDRSVTPENNGQRQSFWPLPCTIYFSENTTDWLVREQFDEIARSLKGFKHLKREYR